MIFQTFDDKKDCLAVYTDNALFLNYIPKKELTHTWDYSESMQNSEIKYAKYYCNGMTLSEACPAHLKKEWDSTHRQLRAFYTSAQQAKLNLNDHCYFELLPKHFLLKYGNIKNEITSYVFNNYKKPADYEFRADLIKVLTEIKNNRLNIDLAPLKSRMHEYKVRQFLQKNQNVQPYIDYNMYGTKTGRLTASGFPILTLQRGYRKILKPNNDWFLEMDYNAAELRVMMGLSGKTQPKDDIHDWNRENIFKGSESRESAKKRAFAWLYNPESKDRALNKEYDREFVLQKYFNGAQVTTIWGRTIDSDEHHALNYIIQSTAADLFLRQMIKVWELLKDRKSSIAFCLHDSLVIDLCEEDGPLIHEIKEAFADTDLGKFKVNVSGGRNFGEMKEMNVR
jgi:hypothetical protein